MEPTSKHSRLDEITHRAIKRNIRDMPVDVYQGLVLLAKRYPRATSSLNAQIDERLLIEKAVAYIRGSNG